MMPLPGTYDGGVGLVDKTILAANTTLWSNGGGFASRNALTAFAGGGQANALALTTTISNVTTVATAGDSVALMSAVGNQKVLISNASANSMNVFSSNASTTDTINGVVGTTAYALAAGKNAMFFSPAAGVWRVILSA